MARVRDLPNGAHVVGTLDFLPSGSCNPELAPDHPSLFPRPLPVSDVVRSVRTFKSFALPNR